ncbi:peptidoglycan hydrolase CwlO-like protein [Olsenella profusa DSM 13989]|uniref:coiled-coil domain-containing protein n=1 Tax=Olsenella profusa TaxID=138595 RepID=UPI00277F1530|nr:hypothetical protein [Olsenella profusa]MDP9859696.1 peptidoglycan hydrolase CwlO-like protein [Olsenella profusa DSM 13989]
MTTRHSWTTRTTTLIATGALVLSMGIASPKPISAETLDDLQQKVEDSNTAYNDATDKVSQIQQKIDDNQQKIDDLERQLPDAQSAAAQSVRAQYKLQEGSAGIFELLLSSESLGDLIENIEYMNAISDYNSEQIKGLVSMAKDLQDTKSDLDGQKAEAEQRQQEAKAALDDAVNARENMQRQMEEQQRQEEADEAAALADAASNSDSSFSTESGNTATVDTPSNDSSNTTTDTTTPSDSPSTKGNPGNADQVSWSSDKTTFVAQWSGRIDRYLAGSPLAGHGATFASAAWDSGVDPRLSPAISAVESSKGAVCFKPHNAWGWGSSSWGDWDTAITAHVSGLAKGYGSALTMSMAKKYCPPNANFWYSSVAANMQQI